MYMNEYDIDNALQALSGDKLMGPAAKYLSAYKDLMNAHSDGWAHWTAGRRCADALSTIVQGASNEARGLGRDYQRPKAAVVRKAMVRIHTYVKTHKQLREWGAEPIPVPDVSD